MHFGGSVWPGTTNGFVALQDHEQFLSWDKLLMAASASALIHTWAGYPACLYLLSRWFQRSPERRNDLFTFSIVVAVHNEEAQIAAKLEDCLAWRYPEGAMEIIVASDGSTDGTEQIVRERAGRDARIRLLRTEGRAGKSGAQNLAAACARGEILLFTDAGTRTQPDLLERVGHDFGDPEVGLVAPVVQFGRFDSAVSRSQGAYWRLEVFVRQMESDLGILATASGSAFAIRRSLFRPIPVQFGDDCIVPLDVRLQGFTVLQDLGAVVSDEMPHSVENELRTRIRMTARNWGGMLSRPGLLNPFRFPGTAWGLISHKLLRWMTPVFLALAFLANGLLAVRGEWQLLLLLQICFYSAAVVGWWRSPGQGWERVFGYPFAFCLANLGFFLGVMRSFRGRRIVAYK
jgi:cellulose synthase/poly-beta-1,6-N-acetylglucosamine synthase-like glycosyltransferase